MAETRQPQTTSSISTLDQLLKQAGKALGAALLVGVGAFAGDYPYRSAESFERDEVAIERVTMQREISRLERDNQKLSETLTSELPDHEEHRGLAQFCICISHDTDPPNVVRVNGECTRAEAEKLVKALNARMCFPELEPAEVSFGSSGSPAASPVRQNSKK
jgi:hypothetical protein